MPKTNEPVRIAILAAVLLSVLRPDVSSGLSIAPGDLLVADDGHAGGSVIRVDRLTGEQEVVASNLGGVTGITVASTGKIYVAIHDSSMAGNDSIVEIDRVSGATTVRRSGISDLEGVSVDASGNLFYVRDAGSSSDVVAFDPSTGMDLAASPVGFTVSSMAFADLTDIALDGGGNVFVGDVALDRVIRIDAAGGAYNGAQITLTGNGTLDDPVGLAFDGGGSLLVADQGLVRLLRLDASTDQNPLSGGTTDNMLRNLVAVADPSGSLIPLVDQNVAPDGPLGTPNGPGVVQVAANGSQTLFSTGSIVSNFFLVTPVDAATFVPEPGTALLLGLGLLGLLALRS